MCTLRPCSRAACADGHNSRKRPYGTAATIDGLLEREQARVRAVTATGVAHGRLHVGRSKKTALGHQRPGLHAREAGAPTRLGGEDVRKIGGDNLVARPAVHEQGDLIAHRTRRQNTAASLPSRSATRSCSVFVVGSAALCSSPTSASAMALRMPAEGLVAVSLERSISRCVAMRCSPRRWPAWKPVGGARARRKRRRLALYWPLAYVSPIWEDAPSAGPAGAPRRWRSACTIG